MGESHPFASQDATDWIVLREGNQNAAHWKIAEHDCQHNRRQHKDEVQLPMLTHIDQCVVHSGSFRLLDRRLCHCSFHSIPPFTSLFRNCANAQFIEAFDNFMVAPGMIFVNK